MRYLKYTYYLIKKFTHTKHGNAQLLTMAGAIFATMAIYFFISITSMNTEDKERVAHLYNAYQMGLSVDALLKNRVYTKGQLEVSYQDENGENRFTKEEFEKYVTMETDTIFTLEELVSDEMLIDARDPTATRLNGQPIRYDQQKTTLKVVFDMVIDYYDENGDAVKKVVDVEYFVNLAGQEVDTATGLTNDPYPAGSNFYYLVSYVDEEANLYFDDITLRREGIVFNGVLDSSTFGTGPAPKNVVILPGDTDL